VYVLQTLGSKRWRIYDGQIDKPVLHPLFRGESKEQLTRLKGTVAREFVMNVGDLLYLPRGRFHDALATEGPSIHISIAVSEPKGLDFINLVMDQAVADPLFREPIPVDKAEMEAHFDKLASRLKLVASSSKIKSQGARLHQNFGKTRPKLQVGRRAKGSY
jgi:ribosomal protein L16 Arg81 hydroxylase